MSGIPNLPETVPRTAKTAADSHVTQVDLEDTPIDNFRRLRVVVIGAGFSGINCGIRIPQRLRNVDLTIYEKNAGIEGTWFENRYPGCACDVPEIHEYLEGVAEKFSATRFIKCNHAVQAYNWDKDSSTWRVTVKNSLTGETFIDEANIVISARGSLNDYKWPNIPGLKDFQGTLMHSAAWDPKAELDGRTIGIIGAGSSAIQIVPELQSRFDVKLKCFIRSRTWISPPFGAQTMQRLGLDGLDFSEDQKQRFLDDPEQYHSFRKVVEQDGNSMHFLTHSDSEMQRMVRDLCEGIMDSRLSTHPEIAEKIKPSFAVGCRRLTPGLGFLEAMTKENVEFIGTEIKKITPGGIMLSNGSEIKLDVLICATGFNAAHAPPFPVTGRRSMDMASRFVPYPKTYLGLAMNDFPNYFSILGPNSLIGTGSLTMMLESEVDYIVKCIRKMQRENIRSMNVKSERVEEFSNYIDEYFKQTVYLDGCSSWYRSDGGRGSRVVGLWPGSCLHAIEAFRAPRWEDFDYEYERDENGSFVSQLKWLGNGFTHSQRFGGGDLAFYLEPEYLDVPSSPLPEETRVNQIRSFCY
ncbi:hypothetical protein LTR66_000953 [Elasticomyces elasticus]|nr:hypothetical protein LTR66_000953 [Elasticomyces elasticus]KAK5011131.1 hypothetical protein LTR28_005450 [Elasticomyces elasticus]